MTRKISTPSLFLLIVLIGFPQISETIYSPILPDLATAMRANDNTIQLTFGIYFLGFALGVFSWGRLSDFIGRRPAMLWGISVYAIGCIACYLSDSAYWLLLSRFVQAFGASVGSVVTQTIIRECMEGSKRQAAFATISAALAFSPAMGPLIGGWMDQGFGYRAVFIVLIGMSIAIFAYAYSSLHETKVSAAVRISLSSVSKRLMKDKRVWAFGLLIGTTNGILFSYYAEAPFLFIEFFHLSPGTFGFLGIFVALASMLGALLSRKLSVRFSAEKLIVYGALITMLGAMLLIGCSYVALSSSLLSLASVVLSVFILLAGIGLMIPNCLSVALVAYSDVLGTAGAMFGLGYYVVVSLITSGMSLLHNDSLLVMPIYFLFLALMMTAVSVSLLVKSKSGTAPSI
ncbi:drug resistance transporter, Bcr/CflA subfamily [Paenibacillaceae bacterium GAS479]|nr:drug resistance transporter, Bcr/CflA subfamily [Paenibacillaceae bacterium GAS479]